MNHNFTITVTGPDDSVCQVLGDEIRAYCEALGIGGAVQHRDFPLEQRLRIIARSRPRVVVTTMDKNQETRKRTALNTAVAKMASYKRQDLPEKGARLLEQIESDQYEHLSSRTFLAVCKARKLSDFLKECRHHHKSEFA
jgi:formylglycine-generating enzyme required for sulfatase activity